jgi:hypothetical protein
VGTNRLPKTKLRMNHGHSLITMQPGHVLRTRSFLLVLRSPARTACSRPSHNRVPLSGMSDDEAQAIRLLDAKDDASRVAEEILMGVDAIGQL